MKASCGWINTVNANNGRRLLQCKGWAERESTKIVSCNRWHNHNDDYHETHNLFSAHGGHRPAGKSAQKILYCWHDYTGHLKTGWGAHLAMCQSLLANEPGTAGYWASPKTTVSASQLNNGNQDLAIFTLSDGSTSRLILFLPFALIIHLGTCSKWLSFLFPELTNFNLPCQNQHLKWTPNLSKSCKTQIPSSEKS